MQPFAPHRLDGTPYRLDSVLGEGAMGEVYLGEHEDLRRPAVIKLIKARFIREEGIVARMRREARIVARIRNDSLVTIYDLGTAADGRTYIAMEYLEGTVLRRILQQRGAIALDEAAKWMAQCCDGLEAAHREGVLHRDVKPENLFIAASGQLKVLDFGVAKPMGEGDFTSAQTAAGMVLGTPRYMAPEQALGRSLSPATDVYAAACVFFELLTGYPVFDAPDTKGLLHHHLATPAPLLSSRMRNADPRAEAIVARALQKEPAHRFATAAEMAAALRALSVRPVAAPRAISVHDKPTIRVDESPTTVDDVHAKPTIRVDGPPPAQTTHAFPLERRSDPSRISYSPPGAAPVSGYDDTRAIPSMNLVAGVSTTEQQPIQTAQTEALSPINAEVSTLSVERRGMPLWPFAIGFVLVAAVGTALVFVTRTKGEEPRVAEQPAQTQTAPAKSVAPAPEPTPTETAAVAPTPTASTTSKPTETVATTAKTTAATTLALKPPTTASTKPIVEAPAAPTQSAYDRAKQLMNDGDLDAAEREARAAVATHGNGARLLLGEILERKGKPGLARDIYKKILESDPSNATAKTRLAKLGG